MKNILLITWGGIHYGGVQLLLLNLLGHMDLSSFNIDLYTFGSIDSEEIYNRFKSLNVRVVTGNHEKYNFKSVALDLKKLIKNNKYDVVHCNTGSVEITAAAMALAKLYGVPVRIAHSHNPKADGTPYAKRERLCQYINKLFSTERLACSAAAAQHMFGINGANKAEILKNGIDAEKYVFNKTLRKAVRAKLNLENKLVIGHIGRFEKQKNHEFLIDVFYHIKKINQNALLVLIGDGSLIEAVKSKAKDLTLSDSIMFAGATNKVGEYLQAMDAFVMPSVFEGLGIAAIEAQAADLPTFCSDAVPEEAVITDRFKYLSLDSGAEIWCDEILNSLELHANRSDRSDDIKNSGYDIKASAQRLFCIYNK